MAAQLTRFLILSLHCYPAVLISFLQVIFFQTLKPNLIFDRRDQIFYRCQKPLRDPEIQYTEILLDSGQVTHPDDGGRDPWMIERISNRNIAELDTKTGAKC